AIRFNGLIDDVRIYNSALSAAQIATLASGNDVTTNWTTSDPIANPTTLDAQQGGRVVYLVGESSVSLTLENLTVRDGLINNSGGGVYVNSGNATLSNVQILSNTANAGGGIYVNSGNATLSNVQILSNRAGGGIGGGGVYVAGGGMATVSGGQIMSNTAFLGGGMHIRSGSATLSNVQILSNWANMGGGMLIDPGNATLNNVQILSNTAFNCGGMEVYEGSATLSNVQILSNLADRDGGGLCVEASGTAIVSGGQVVNNSANYVGGGLAVYSGTLVVTNTTVSRNQANSLSYGGGAIYQSSGHTTIANGTIVSNTAATTSRSGIWLESGTLEIGNSIIAHNGITNNVVISDGLFTSLGYNLTNSDAGAPFTVTTDLANTDPLLGPLQDNGGSTWTYALLPNSPALDRIPFGLNGCGTTIAIDQRGWLRPALPGGKCDIGAYEAYEYLRFVYLPLIMK
ncbi:MAG TPA: choice-of-anchor Q domain-containing protein, partial [Anaerolineae bacterium]|nr:choice-of-anchor Q domain-containing protein [Anaerolineae bacterium]